MHIFILLNVLVASLVFAEPHKRFSKPNHFRGTRLEANERRKITVELDPDSVKGNSTMIDLELPSGEVVTAILQQKRVGRNRFVYKGHIQNYQDSLIILSKHDSYFFADITIDDKVYEVKYEGSIDGKILHKIVERKIEVANDEGDSVNDEAPKNQNDVAPLSYQANDVNAPSTETNGNGTIIMDLMVLYTTQAKGTRTTSSMEQLIVTAVEKANTAFENSLINARLNIVAMIEMTGYTETGWENDYDNFAIGYRGFENVPTWRNVYGADLVSLLVLETGSSGAVGTAPMLTFSPASPNVVSESYFYSMVNVNNASSNLSTAHEIGHNLGAGHDAANGSRGRYTDSYGYVFGNYRTVMAYGSKTRVPYYSNPNVTYQTLATGSSTAYNAKAIRDTVAFASRYRVSVEPPSNAPSISITNPSNASSVNGTVNIQASITSSTSISKVEFFINNVKLSEDTTNPYSTSWNSTQTANGSTKVKAIATDSNTNQFQTEITVTVQNVTPDTTPPAVPKNLRFE